MHYGNIKYCDIADGEGVRTSLFVSGCTHHCRGCFQSETWDFFYGEEFTPQVEEQILESLKPSYIDGLTVLGGEPMEPQNQEVLLPFLRHVKDLYPMKSIWIFSGDTYEELLDEQGSRKTDATEPLLDLIDVLVDGRFVEELKDISLRFRGSSNQRLIDMPATRAAGEVVLWRGDETFAERGTW